MQTQAQMLSGGAGTASQQVGHVVGTADPGGSFPESSGAWVVVRPSCGASVSRLSGIYNTLTWLQCCYQRPMTSSL